MQFLVQVDLGSNLPKGACSWMTHRLVNALANAELKSTLHKACIAREIGRSEGHSKREGLSVGTRSGGDVNYAERFPDRLLPSTIDAEEAGIHG